jgi:hypothetical protein
MSSTIVTKGKSQLKVSSISEESRKLLDKLIIEDEKRDREEFKKSKEANVEEKKEEKKIKITSEKSEILKPYLHLKTPEEFIRQIVVDYEKNKELNSLKNSLLGMCVLLMNHDCVGEKLPLAQGMDPFLAASNYYKPHNYIREGIESKIDQFIDEKITNDEKSRDKFLRSMFYILVCHFKEKTNQV